MSLENYAIHIAPRGGKIDLIVDEINAARQTAFDTRTAYSRSKGAIGLYQNESSVAGLLFAKDAILPDGWAVDSREGNHVVAVPKSKDRTKQSRAQTNELKAEMAALPALPALSGSRAFTACIGSSEVITSSDSGHGFALRACSFERIGEVTFVFTPWSTKTDETGEVTDAKVTTAFLPEGCERVGLSVYYAAKEAQEAKDAKDGKAAA